MRLLLASCQTLLHLNFYIRQRFVFNDVKIQIFLKRLGHEVKSPLFQISARLPVFLSHWKERKI